MDSTVVRSTPRVFGGAALFGAVALAGALLATPAHAATTAPDVTGAACAEGEGVSVVVDFSDLGGEIVVGCATGSPASGREALEAAGFAPEDSMPGMICTIDSQPDPCPEEFDGNFWSYWHADDRGADWEMYMVGADEAEPAAGSVEGWRYFDGSAGPTITPDQVAAAGAAAGGADSAASSEADSDADSEADGEASEDTADQPSTPEEVTSGLPTWAFIVIALGAAGALITLLARRRNQ